MATYYSMKVVMCRERGDTKAVGSMSYKEPDRDEWLFEYESAEDEGEDSREEFLNAMVAALASAPQHVGKIKKSGTGSLRAALDASATTANDSVSAEGPWSERVGKDVFRYSIGVSGDSAAAARTRTAHNLS